MKIYIANAFSLSMLQRDHQRDDVQSSRLIVPRPVDDPRAWLSEWLAHGAQVESILGHASTQALFEGVLGVSCPVNRISFRFAPLDRYGQRDELVLIGQYSGPRLVEGATQLPEGATLEWWCL